MPRTRTCTQAIRSGRMRKANQFLAAADNLVRSDANETAEIADAYVTLCVHSAIAASDVVCCVSLGEHAQGDNHIDAVTLLRKADPDSAKHLDRLLRMKTKAGYSHITATTDDCKRAYRAAEALLEAARRAHALTGR